MKIKQSASFKIDKQNMIKPYKHEQGSKKEQVGKMFDSIAHKYDFLNHFLSLGIDKSWRRKAIKKLKNRTINNLLDVATGTGDLALTASKKLGCNITGIDLSEQMLVIGRQKIEKLQLSKTINLIQGDSENLPFASDFFDAVTVAFGVRNFENLDKGLLEMQRVLKPGGVAVVLEFSMPQHSPFKNIYSFYFKYILPIIGRLVSKDMDAYKYLPESVAQFPCGKTFVEHLEKAGFKNCSIASLTFGIATIYTGEKL
jgi:demethylmenaquinone methyltransferase / 2-methoxy-6-polyprenyl-1,4-benzoquinol methylase